MALTGMVFVLSGSLSQTRSVFSQKIQDANGIVVGTVTKKVTHVLCGDGFEETDKFKKFKKSDQAGVHAVTEAFIDACIKAHSNSKSLPSEDEFNPENEAPKKAEDTQSDDAEEAGAPDETEVTEAETEAEAEADPPTSQKAKGTPRKPPRRHKKAVDNALKGWILYISGGTKDKDEIRDLVEEHGGTLAKGSNYADVTHILGSSSGKKIAKMVDLGAVMVTEDFIRETIDDYKPPTLLIPASPSAKGKKKKTVEKVISRRLYKGDMHFVVQYVGLEDEENELLSHDQVIERGGEKALKKFESAWKKEMNVFNFSKSEAGKTSTAPKDSPRIEKKRKDSPKKEKSQPPAKKTKKETKPKNSPKKKISTPKASPKKKESTPKKTTPKKKDRKSVV